MELMVSQLLARQKEAQSQNAALKGRLRSLEDSLEKLKGAEAELRALKEWKRNTQAVLRRMAGRLEKEIAKAKEEQQRMV